MKKMMLGMMFFICGFIGILTFVFLSVEKFWNYDGINGFDNFLLKTNTSGIFFTVLVFFILGLFICINETYPIKMLAERFYKYLQTDSEKSIDSEYKSNSND